MVEIGARRIKRPLLIDQASERFLSADEQARLLGFALIEDYLIGKQGELECSNAPLVEVGRDLVA